MNGNPDRSQDPRDILEILCQIHFSKLLQRVPWRHISLVQRDNTQLAFSDIFDINNNTHTDMKPAYGDPRHLHSCPLPVVITKIKRKTRAASCLPPDNSSAYQLADNASRRREARRFDENPCLGVGASRWCMVAFHENPRKPKESPAP
ncbi:hypothetical protein ElyMa_006255600 [Elysia marginata]|uniref:Uncharacterized protein n=1 Tax=Elysia marginata TaxID=1093978 RepID=A0AAV4HD62_9GAST|nr:hypothetical protein ElyMa_006255600 [Elysia marginata]